MGIKNSKVLTVWSKSNMLILTAQHENILSRYTYLKFMLRNWCNYIIQDNSNARI